MNKDKGQVVLFLLKLCLTLAAVGCFAFMWYEFYSDRLGIGYYQFGNYVVIGLYLVLYIFLANIYSAFRVGYYHVSELIYTQGITFFLTNVVAYIVICLLYRGLSNIFWMLALLAVEILLSAVWAYVSNRIYYNANPRDDMAVVYQNKSFVSLLNKMKAYPEKYNVVEQIPLSNGIENIKKDIKCYRSVLLCELPDFERNQLIKFCVQEKIRCYLTPNTADILISGSDRVHLFDTPLLVCSNKGQRFFHRAGKRALDIVASGVMIVIFAIPMAITAICVKAYDKGPVLYSQNRLTKDSKVFKVYKFRSMVTDAEKDGIARLSTKNDSRITPVGKVIRATRLDELPQLFNIFKGDMTLVGPRPERPEIAEQYYEKMPEFALRLQVKAGLTGYAQIFGKYNTTPKDKLKLDLMYIADNSLFLDFKLLFLTFKTMFMKDSTEGIEEGAVTAGEGE